MPRLLFGIPGLTFCLILVSQIVLVPIWDAWIYAACAANAAAHPSELHAYSCAGHLSHAYIALLSLPTRFAEHQRMWHLLLTNAALGVAAISAIMSIARSMLPGRKYAWDVLLRVHPNQRRTVQLDLVSAPSGGLKLFGAGPGWA